MVFAGNRPPYILGQPSCRACFGFLPALQALAHAASCNLAARTAAICAVRSGRATRTSGSSVNNSASTTSVLSVMEG